jgi:hypothetical protein
MSNIQALLIATVLSFLTPLVGQATVLCAPEGGLENSFLEGGAVVVRSTCQPGETQVRPFAFLSNGDLLEAVPRGKQTVVANGYSVVVGQDYHSTAGGAVTIQAGSDFTATVGGSASTMVGQDSTENVAGDLNVEVGQNTFFNSSKNFQVRANGDIIIGNRRARLVLRRNGSVLLTGTRVNVKGGGRTIQLKGGKISEN